MGRWNTGVTTEVGYFHLYVDVPFLRDTRRRDDDAVMIRISPWFLSSFLYEDEKYSLTALIHEEGKRVLAVDIDDVVCESSSTLEYPQLLVESTREERAHVRTTGFLIDAERKHDSARRLETLLKHQLNCRPKPRSVLDSRP